MLFYFWFSLVHDTKWWSQLHVWILRSISNLLTVLRPLMKILNKIIRKPEPEECHWHRLSGLPLLLSACKPLSASFLFNPSFTFLCFYSSLPVFSSSTCLHALLRKKKKSKCFAALSLSRESVVTQPIRWVWSVFLRCMSLFTTFFYLRLKIWLFFCIFRCTEMLLYC